MAEHVSSNTLAKMKAADWDSDRNPVTLQITDIQHMKELKYKCKFTDGTALLDGILATQVGKMAADGSLKNNDIVQLNSYTCNLLGGVLKLICTGAEVVGGCDQLLLSTAATKKAGPLTPAAVNANVKDEQMADASVKDEPMAEEPAGPAAIQSTAKTPAPKKENVPMKMEMDTPAMRRVGALTPGGFSSTPGATPSPSHQVKGSISMGSARKPLQPIQALNPYNNNWTIKARVVSKGSKRSFSRNGESISVFSIDLVDDLGTQIEGTLWRELADKYHDLLEEGKVYYFSKGKVKPANKQYTTVRNDYVINFDSGTEIEECPDQDASKMQAKLDVVPIEQLASFIGKKAPVDVMGVVTAVGPLGSVKRKADDAEFSRREVTLVDRSLKTVSLTLWGGSAEVQGAALEGLDHPVVTVTACRVSDFNGVSVSALQRSVLEVDPDTPPARALKHWYAAEGRSAAVSHAGEGLANATRAGSGGGGQERATMRALMAAPAGALPSPEAKPEYHSLTCTIAAVDPAQTLYYMANPENNRKVVEQNGSYYCEFDQKSYPTMVRRYVLSVKACDATGEGVINLFNDQAEELLGMSADDMAALREGDEAAYQRVLRTTQWSEWLVRVQRRTREYNGEVRPRCSVQSLKPINYVTESRRIVDWLSKQATA